NHFGTGELGLDPTAPAPRLPPRGVGGASARLAARPTDHPGDAATRTAPALGIARDGTHPSCRGPSHALYRRTLRGGGLPCAGGLVDPHIAVPGASVTRGLSRARAL